MKWTSFLVLFIWTFSAYTQSDYPLASFQNPQETMNYLLKTMKGHKLGDTDAINLAIQSFDQSGLDKNTKNEVLRLAATRLINTLDRLEYIDIKLIPTQVNGKKWVYRKSIVKVNNTNHPVEISIHKVKSGKWLFSPITLKTIIFYERSLRKKEIVKGVTALSNWRTKLKDKMPEWTSEQSFILLNGQWLALFTLMFMAFVIEKIFRVYIASFLVGLLRKRNISIDDNSKKKFTFPLGIISFSLIWTLGLPLLELDGESLSWLLRLGRVVCTFGIIMALYQAVDIFTLYLQKMAELSENKFDDILAPLVGKSSKTFVVAIGIIAIGDSLSLDMKGILAGMGIVGLGISLAAKDTISNLFGSLTVLLDRPFRIGDWVMIDGDIEGTVQEVGLRSCRIRTFYDSVITLPNGRLTNAHIDNYGQRTYRRYTTKLGLQYDTPPEKLEAFCEGIRKIIVKHPHTRKEYFHVYFNSMGDSALEVLVYLFWYVPDWSQELQERHRLLLDILRLGKEMEINFAFPTQTLHVTNTPSPSYSPLQSSEITSYANEKAHNLEDMTFKDHRSGMDQLK